VFVESGGRLVEFKEVEVYELADTLLHNFIVFESILNVFSMRE